MTATREGVTEEQLAFADELLNGPQMGHAVAVRIAERERRIRAEALAEFAAGIQRALHLIQTSPRPMRHVELELRALLPAPPAPERTDETLGTRDDRTPEQAERHAAKWCGEHRKRRPCSECGADRTGP